MYPGDENAARQSIVAVGLRMWQRGLVSANDGNVSVRLTTDTFLCTPTGMSKGAMRPSDLAVVAADGGVLDAGTGRGPSSEIRMHLGVYSARPDVNAVVHAHPPYATLAAIVGTPLDQPLLPEIVVAMPRVPVAPYATPSTDAVPESVVPLTDDHSACLLEQHGALTWAADLESAYLDMERVEYFAQMTQLLRQTGVTRVLEPEKITALKSRFGIA